jgi:hypothetical protein
LRQRPNAHYRGPLICLDAAASPIMSAVKISGEMTP